jgi:hypothetical protein
MQLTPYFSRGKRDKENDIANMRAKVLWGRNEISVLRMDVSKYSVEYLFNGRAPIDISFRKHFID